MTKLATLSAALACALSLAAAPALAQPAAPTPTRDFLAAAAQSDQFEITEAQVVGTQSQNPRVLAFARQMTDDHASTTAALKRAAAKSGVQGPPEGISGDQARLLGALQSLKGPAFDKAYARQQVLAHQSALVVEQGYADRGADPNVRQAAQAAIPTIQHHLDMARGLQAELGGS